MPVIRIHTEQGERMAFLWERGHLDERRDPTPADTGVVGVPWYNREPGQMRLWLSMPGDVDVEWVYVGHAPGGSDPADYALKADEPAGNIKLDDLLARMSALELQNRELAARLMAAEQAAKPADPPTKKR